MPTKTTGAGFVSTHQPPEGGWLLFQPPQAVACCFNTPAARRRLAQLPVFPVTARPRFNTPAARRRLVFKCGNHRFFTLARFNTPAARRRLVSHWMHLPKPPEVSTHQPPEGGWIKSAGQGLGREWFQHTSRPKAAGWSVLCCRTVHNRFNTPAARRRLANRTRRAFKNQASFNTPAARRRLGHRHHLQSHHHQQFQHTSRPKAAGFCHRHRPRDHLTFQHTSRPKAAGR